MAKQNKKTRESQYTEILAGQNKTLAQCSVLGFRFPDEAHADQIRAIAEQAGGTDYKPNLKV